MVITEAENRLQKAQDENWKIDRLKALDVEIDGIEVDFGDRLIQARLRIWEVM